MAAGACRRGRQGSGCYASSPRRTARVGWCLVAAPVFLAGCPTTPEGFDSPDPNLRVRAIVEAAERGDESAIPELVQQLESIDPLSRLLAARTLRDLSGEDFGYDYAAEPWARAPAVDRWAAWARRRAEAARTPGSPASGG